MARHIRGQKLGGDGVVLSEAEFHALMAKNPQLRIQSSSKPFGSSLIADKKKLKTPKYRNMKVYLYEDGFVSEGKAVDGHGATVELYDSIKEYQRGLELRRMERAGLISELSRQVELVIQESFSYQGKRVQKIAYKADYMYLREGIRVVEDVKPFDQKRQQYRLTKDFSLKWKLLKARYPAFSFELF